MKRLEDEDRSGVALRNLCVSLPSGRQVSGIACAANKDYGAKAKKQDHHQLPFAEAERQYLTIHYNQTRDLLDFAFYGYHCG